jgi:phosphoglycerate kinase
MPKKTIEQIDVRSKNVLIRVDFNVPIDNGAISDDRRIRAAIPTIRSVIDRGGRAVLMSHLGRPEGTGYEESHSLKPVAKKLSELLGTDAKCPGQLPVSDEAKAAVQSMNDADIVVLENLRFDKREKSGDETFAKQLADLADIYVNDAFGTCHRTDASMYAVPKAMGTKPTVVGYLVEKEIRYLSAALASPERPFTVILGGAKVSDKLPAIENLLPKADNILIGGAMAYTFLKALGHNIGASRVEENMIEDAKRILDHAAEARVDLHLPEDHICSTAFSETSGDIEVFDDQIPDGFMGLDIGPKTQAHYATLIKSSKTIVWNGPMGVFEWAPFKVGTKHIAQACAAATKNNSAVTIVGGGDSAAAAELFGVASQLSHVSTGGGASLEMLEGKPFKALEVIDDA